MGCALLGTMGACVLAVVVVAGTATKTDGVESAIDTGSDVATAGESLTRATGESAEGMVSPRLLEGQLLETAADPSPVKRVPESGSGTFDRARIPTVAKQAETTYAIEVEDNLPIATRSFAKRVRQTLADPRGWTAGDLAVLAPTNNSADLRIVLTTPETTDRLCAPLQTRGRVSCRNGRDVVINAWRWVNGAAAYEGDIDGYRRYLINHEVGHALGNGHEPCPKEGDLAPVMLQQTLGLQGCRSNPWPSRVDLVSS